MKSWPLEKTNQGYAGYRAAFSAARCASCEHFKKGAGDVGSCELVDGSIDPDCVCDLFAPERGDATMAANKQYESLMNNVEKTEKDE